MKPIKDYEDLYAITSCGKVWSYRRQKFLSLGKDKDGYLLVGLHKDGVRKTFRVHRLVAEAYIPNPEGKSDVNHLDEDKTHNYVNNLCWMTSTENNNYGTRNVRAGKAVICEELNRVFDTQSQAAKELGLSVNAINKCVRGKTKTCGGYHWRYVNE